MSELIYPDETYAIRGAIYEVHNVMGSGFLEAVYQECLAKEFGRRRIPFQAQAELRLMYKDEPLVQVYKADFICFERIIVELKVVKELAPEHRVQVLN